MRPDLSALPSEALVAAPGVHPFVLDDEVLLFCAADGQFVRIGPAPLHVWSARRDGRRWADIHADLDLPMRQLGVDVWLPRIVAELQAGGLLTATPADRPSPEAPPERPWSGLWPRFEAPYHDFRQIRCKGHGVEVDIRFGTPALAQWFGPLVAPLQVADDGRPRHLLTVASIGDYHYVYSDNVLVRWTASLAELTPWLMRAITEVAIWSRRPALALVGHALRYRDKTLILLGAASALCACRLLARGATLIASDVLLFSAGDPQLAPAPYPVAVPDSQWADDVGGPWAEARRQALVDGAWSNLLVPRATTRGRAADEACTLVLTRFDPGSAPALTPRSRAEGFERALAAMHHLPWRLDLAGAATLVELVERATCLELRADSAAGAIDLLDASL